MDKQGLAPRDRRTQRSPPARHARQARAAAKETRRQPAKVVPEAVAGLFDCIQLNVPPPKKPNLKTTRRARRWCHPPNVATHGRSKCNGVSTLPRRQRHGCCPRLSLFSPLSTANTTLSWMLLQLAQLTEPSRAWQEWLLLVEWVKD